MRFGYHQTVDVVVVMSGEIHFVCKHGTVLLYCIHITFYYVSYFFVITVLIIASHHNNEGYRVQLRASTHKISTTPQFNCLDTITCASSAHESTTTARQFANDCRILNALLVRTADKNGHDLRSRSRARARFA